MNWNVEIITNPTSDCFSIDKRRSEKFSGDIWGLCPPALLAMSFYWRQRPPVSSQVAGNRWRLLCRRWPKRRTWVRSRQEDFLLILGFWIIGNCSNGWMQEPIWMKKRIWVTRMAVGDIRFGIEYPKETEWTEYYWLMLVEALSSIISHLVAGYMVIDYTSWALVAMVWLFILEMWVMSHMTMSLTMRGWWWVEDWGKMRLVFYSFFWCKTGWGSSHTVPWE